MTGESKQTTNHKKIMEWVEERGGKPAAVKGTGEEGEAGVLRIVFPSYSKEELLEEISWEEFFDTFEKNKLAFVYQDKLASGEVSRFFKLVLR